MKNKLINKSFKTTLYLPDKLHSELKIQAAKLRTSMTNIINQAIQNELNKLSKHSKSRNQ
jgi:predicted HicB family RNase H-like nuclease